MGNLWGLGHVTQRIKLIWVCLSKPFWDPILVGIGEFTTHFRTYFSDWLMFTGGTIWLLTHDHLRGCQTSGPFLATTGGNYRVRPGGHAFDPYGLRLSSFFCGFCLWRKHPVLDWFCLEASTFLGVDSFSVLFDHGSFQKLDPFPLGF